MTPSMWPFQGQAEIQGSSPTNSGLLCLVFSLRCEACGGSKELAQTSSLSIPRAFRGPDHAPLVFCRRYGLCGVGIPRRFGHETLVAPNSYPSLHLLFDCIAFFKPNKGSSRGPWTMETCQTRTEKKSTLPATPTERGSRLWTPAALLENIELVVEEDG